MPSVRFTLRYKKKEHFNKLQSIYVIYNFDSRKKILYATPYKTKLKYWNLKKYRIKSTDEKNKDIINNGLNEIKNSLEKYITECKYNKIEVTKELIKKFLDEYFNPTLKKNKNSLFEFIDEFIKKSKTRINHKTGKRISYKTIREYNRTFYYLKEYVKDRKITLDFENIDLNFYDDFLEYLQSLNLATNTIGHKILTLKTFLNDATDRNINTNLAFKTSKFKVLKESVKNVYLNDTELKQIFDYDFSKNKRLETVRDIFVFACNTGMRFSDIKEVNYDIIDKKYIINTQLKTGNTVSIPIFNVTKKILEKYNYELPKVISNQKFNEYIKEICRVVGIKEKVKKQQTKGGVKQVEILEKWQRVGTHTARRSFATNMYKKQVPSITIMQITGHKSEVSFLKYIQVTPKEHADLMKSIIEKFNKENL